MGGREGRKEGRQASTCSSWRCCRVAALITARAAGRAARSLATCSRTRRILPSSSRTRDSRAAKSSLYRAADASARMRVIQRMLNSLDIRVPNQNTDTGSRHEPARTIGAQEGCLLDLRDLGRERQHHLFQDARGHSGGQRSRLGVIRAMKERRTTHASI